ncbi:hypothetical protein GGTG_05904 [Gaeumannomyces tritici R3-111a-1]|uniref:Uncharacterized protein n=1 Tax=Gaeumannomyces tritici (strain R3-111a-1) TaxID=644352 RepID=J3NX97_GAET3|nr:hypothetical protein GGTG_05904 [Gaeumannomyces tritici R3-111a-1]EJT75979.1 hypothetical protein GGTG_05904 [Gaeumannomyces tritici R3-111a-1]
MCVPSPDDRRPPLAGLDTSPAFISTPSLRTRPRTTYCASPDPLNRLSPSLVRAGPDSFVGRQLATTTSLDMRTEATGAAAEADAERTFARVGLTLAGTAGLRDAQDLRW